MTFLDRATTEGPAKFTGEAKQQKAGRSGLAANGCMNLVS
jgi:hypothetical protein